MFDCVTERFDPLKKYILQNSLFSERSGRCIKFWRGIYSGAAQADPSQGCQEPNRRRAAAVPGFHLPGGLVLNCQNLTSYKKKTSINVITKKYHFFPTKQIITTIWQVKDKLEFLIILYELMVEMWKKCRKHSCFQN